MQRGQVIAAAAIGLAGIVAVLAGLTKPDVLLVGVGSLAVLIASVRLMPLVARPISSALGRPLAALLGTPGRLGQENSTRNPRRTAQTAAALMVGLSLVSTIAVLGASLSTSAKNSVRQCGQRGLHRQRHRRLQQVGRRRRLPCWQA